MNIVVFWEEGFPCIETREHDPEELRAGVGEGDTLDFVGLDGLAEALKDTTSVLILPYGSAFPKAAWPTLYSFLNRGGSWVNLGGSPFSRPVRRNADGSWHTEVAQTAYSKELFINQAFPIDCVDEGITDWEWTDALARLAPELPVPQMTRAWSLQVRFTDTKDYPRENGSSGTRDATLRTQCFGIRDGKRIAAPIVIIDRLRGPFAGGTWALVNAALTQPLDAAVLRALLQRAAQGPIELDVRPTYACYYEKESPALTLRVKLHRNSARLSISAGVGAEGLAQHFTELALGEARQGQPLFAELPLPDYGSAPGLHRVRVSLRAEGTEEPLAVAETGFWGYDHELLISGKPLTLNRDYFERDGETYPVMGTTYMAGDTHRKFLFEPNPVVWERDFAAMKAAGVNMVRTGLWTAFRRAMLDPGAIDEGVLRAFTAFLLTARKHDIPVTFNFFAFWPEEWGGSNPYLDPRAVAAQQELVGAFAHRFAHVNDLIWDFINEPSVLSPARVWSTRPNYDAFERAAWAEWLAERAKTSFAAEEAAASDPADVWRERWRLTPNAPLDLPALADFQDRYIFQGTHPLRVLDYRLFAQDMFNNWVRTLTETIRSNGNPQQLITVGQDEGGTGERPNTHFYADVVDFTTNHSWWQNDDLLWDSVMTKTPNKPMLIQETGIMFVENVDGGYRRTPEDCALLLARKLTLAFAAGGAGAIQWLWNTNIYMDDDNEVGIGFLRADGTEKPELEIFRGIAKFFQENRDLMRDRQREETVLVVPHSNMFSVRNTADAALRRAVRVLEYDLGIPVRTVSEYRIQDIGDPRFIILPSPRVLMQTCWETLLAKVEAGSTLLVTGFVEADEYWRPIARLAEFGVSTTPAAVNHVEPVRVANADNDLWCEGLFSGDKIHKLEKADTGETPLALRGYPHGRGEIYLCPIPIELAEVGEDNPGLSVIYSSIAEHIGLKVVYGSAGVLDRRIPFAEAQLCLAINETSPGFAPESFGEASASTPEQPHPLGVHLAPGESAVGFLDKQNRVIAVHKNSLQKRKESEENAKETNSNPSNG